MRHVLIIIISLILSQPLFTQTHHDNNWLMADSDGARLISFTSGTPEVEISDASVPIDNYSTMMSDEGGNLQFYSNGCKVYGANHQLLTNGDTLNYGEIYNDYCNRISNPRAYPGLSSALVTIPRPNHPDQYLIFHKSLDLFEEPIPNESLAYYSRFYYAIVDMTAENGMGAVTRKHIPVDDRFAEHDIILNRHANGKDWWMISPLRNSNEYATYLVDSSGVVMTSIQAIGIADDRWSRGGGQSVFGPLGQQLVRWNTVSGLQLFDFDRETGTLSNFEFYPSPLMGGRDFIAGGVGLSPSGQYAYVSTVLDIYQYDLWAEDIGNSQLHVAEIGNPDSLWVGVAPTAYNFQLGPDCKLYSYNNSGYEHHVIHQPDEQGSACDWEQGGLELLNFPVFRDMPHFPNYRLGPLGDEGSQCVGPIVSRRTITNEAPNYLSVYPNPVRAGSPISLSLSGVFPGGHGDWELFDAQGRLVLRNRLPTGVATAVPVPNRLTPGPYYWRLSDRGIMVNTGKLVIQ